MRSRFPRWAAIRAAASALSLLTVMSQSGAQLALAGPTCTIASGFYDLTGQVFIVQGGNVVGDCAQNAYWDPPTGNVMQPTNAGGILFLRSCDQVTAYTDGTQTSLLGPNGPQTRQN